MMIRINFTHNAHNSEYFGRIHSGFPALDVTRHTVLGGMTYRNTHGDDVTTVVARLRNAHWGPGNADRSLRFPTIEELRIVMQDTVCKLEAEDVARG